MKIKNLKKAFAVVASVALGGIIGLGASLTPKATATTAAANDFVSKYRAEATDAFDALKRADEINQQIEEEGAVLLKNQDETLPLKTGSRISVFGKNSINPFYTGAGSASGGDGSGNGGVKSYTFLDGLENAGYVLNPNLVSFYNNNSQSGSGRNGGSGTGNIATYTGETPVSSYNNTLRASFANYNDAAIVFLARAGGEGGDLRANYTSNTGGFVSGDHYLELDKNEKDMIDMVKQNFSKVIVLLNMGTSFELGSLKADTGIDSIMWVGYPGGSGFNALGKVLNGEATPSGRLADIYSADFKADPTYPNFGSNYSSSYTGSGSFSFVEYDEGIYVGYRYYETRGFVEGGNWYNNNVVYPFGYGISYTTFEKSTKFLTDTLSAEGEIKAEVTVTNTGKYPGKEVVQMYYTAPYYEGEIEKSHIVLGGFEKTDVIEPGQSQKITVSMKVRDMASYDYNDANADSIYGYELDPGEYTVYVGDGSHVWADESAAKKVYDLSDTIYYDKDSKTGAPIKNNFDHVSVYFDQNSSATWAGHSSVMSRADFEGTFPKSPTSAQRQISAAENATQSMYSGSASASYDQGKPWYTSEMPTYQTTRQTRISATRLVGLDFNDRRWEQFMDQLTFNDMAGLVMHGYFTTDAISDLDIPQSITPDGPTGFVQGSGSNWVSNTCIYAAPIVVASTWNKELANAMGKAVGDEGIYGGDRGVTNAETVGGRSPVVQGGYNGWYAPGNNIHRSPFSGRNFEYYSEDPMLAGTICANVVAGAQSKGIFVMMKHFALNDQETSRGNIATWATEQTMREIYLKSFEIAVKDGGATGMMSAFNRIGYEWAGFSYALLTETLRNEWGFNGVVITDWVNNFMKADFMVRAGNDLWLANGNINNLNSTSARTATHVAAVRRAAKSVLYAVINSNAMNRLGARYSAEHLSANTYRVNLGTVNKGATVNRDMHSNVYTSYKYALNGAPKGITIDENTGVISGTVAEDASSGDYIMSVSLKDDQGFIGQNIILTMTVNGGITYTGVDSAKVAPGKFARVDVSSERKGSSISYSVSGNLPEGMAISGDGYIIGVPEQEGTYTFTVSASTSGQTTTTKQVTITVAAPVKLAYTGKTLDGATAETAYTANVATATGADGITYTASDMPAGLSLSSSGTITGTPTAAGTYTISVTASAPDCESTTAQFTLTVAAKQVTPVNPDTGSSTKPDTSSTKPAESTKKKGCKGTLGGGFALLSVLGLSAVAVLKKRKND